MPSALASAVEFFLRAGALLLIANEIRGLVLAAPVLYAMYEAGGTMVAIWVGISSLGGIALSVFVPLIAARKLRHWRPQVSR